MRKNKFKGSIELMPGIGFYIGFDKGRSSREFNFNTFVIVLPFIGIIITYKDL